MDDAPKNRFVGKGKTNLTSRWIKEGRKERRSQDELLAHLKEFEEWANPAFNVLIVQTPRPGFFDNQWLKQFRETVNETGELLQKCLRFGLPQTSVVNKLPFWREDNSPLPTTPWLPLRKSLANMTSSGHPLPHPSALGSADAKGRAQDAVNGISHAALGGLGGPNMHLHHRHGGDHEDGKHAQAGCHHSKFLFDGYTVSPGMILGINMALWWYLSTPIDAQGPG